MFKDKGLKNYLEYLTLGTEIAFTIGAPILIGFWIDSRYDTSPWFILGGVLLAMTMLVVMLIRLNRKLNKSE
ncbi:MAG: AtpZ/AtpI family protein [Balneolaceae bacterium]|nr:MAG: AtpZ/AtpI family protein [Balneolaceae bacterium]